MRLAVPTRVRRMALLSALTLIATAVGDGQPFGRPPALRNIGLDQHLNQQIPLDLTFADESGNAVRFGDLLRGRPVVLSLVYYQCPMLCNMVLNGEVHAMRNISLRLGSDYDAITVSFDPAETPQLAAAKKAAYIDRFPDASVAPNWRFLTGREPEIKALASTVGFRYAWDNITKQWAHASGIIVLTPEGRIARYLYGIEYTKQDLRLALVEAAQRKFASAVDQILLFCYHYDPARGRYGLAILNTLKAAGSATALALGFFVFAMLRRDFKKGGKT
jgi:protein SCO1